MSPRGIDPVRIVDGEVVTAEGTSSGHQQEHQEKTAKSLPAVANQLESRATRDAPVCQRESWCAYVDCHSGPCEARVRHKYPYSPGGGDAAGRDG